MDLQNLRGTKTAVKILLRFDRNSKFLTAQACLPPTLFWRINSRHSRIDAFPSAWRASGGQSRGKRELVGRPIVVCQNASVGEKPRTDGIAILLVGTQKTRYKSERNIETAFCRTAQALPLVKQRGFSMVSQIISRISIESPNRGKKSLKSRTRVDKTYLGVPKGELCGDKDV